jgi:hypothetical protein
VRCRFRRSFTKGEGMARAWKITNLESGWRSIYLSSSPTDLEKRRSSKAFRVK